MNCAFGSQPEVVGDGVARMRVSDGASLSGNGVAIQALLELGRVTGDKRYTDAARRAALWAATQLADIPEAMSSILANRGKLSVPARR